MWRRAALTLVIAAAVTVVAPLGAAAAPVEDDDAGCLATALPDAGALPSIAKLPDPFRRLDGTRISSAADWRCQRNETRRLAEKFVYGPGASAGSSTCWSSPAARSCGPTRRA
ncbi:hypothetical protein AB0C07_28750 [Actinoplanes missouriensis]|uniref:hypothetical protein n=1 Tax=Actinoplanes missouriensis TaxID=1866 RepID=UPI00340FE343